MANRDHPGDFSNHVGDDLYLNPWWGRRRRQLHQPAQAVLGYLDLALGRPDLWYNGIYHCLLWGPREYPTEWRPSFYVAASGDGEVYSHLWLPWRGEVDWRVGAGPGWTGENQKELPEPWKAKLRSAHLLSDKMNHMRDSKLSRDYAGIVKCSERPHIDLPNFVRELRQVRERRPPLADGTPKIVDARALFARSAKGGKLPN